MLLTVVFLVVCDCGYEGKIFSLVIVLETSLMHSKVNFGIVVFLAVNNKFLVEAVISYSVFMYRVIDGKDVSDSGLIKPHILDLACYHFLVIYKHFSSIASESHLLLILVDTLHSLFI